jgi:hypothetical protein
MLAGRQRIRYDTEDVGSLLKGGAVRLNDIALLSEIQVKVTFAPVLVPVEPQVLPRFVIRAPVADTLGPVV